MQLRAKYLLADNLLARFHGVHHTGEARVRINVRRDLFIDVVRGEITNETTY
jgi:hypothetical protein